jgi:para-nitrobenzyl esterase
MRQRTSSLRLVVGGLALAAAAVLGACSSSSGAAPAATTASTAAPLTVDTTSGRLQGTATARAREFLGVRYAQPPTGSRRWTMPVAPATPSGTVRATTAGPSCAQAGTAPGASSTGSTSEDCLFLNVTTPRSTRPGETLPVMVWWHGGGYTSGSGSAYDAQRLAARGHVVVVTVNYRLGVFGYLSLPGLAGSGDFGLADQLLATRWARDNAAAFGGDPHNLTVFGESAGAMSACAALTSPAAKGLFDKVALSSGSCELNWPTGTLLPGTPAQTPYVDLADGDTLGRTGATTLGCTGTSTLACLRRASVTKLLTISPLFSDVLAYGTALLPENPATALAAGHVRPVPVLSSGNHDEERAFVGGVEKTKPTFTDATYPTYLKQAFGADAAKVAAQYPLTDYPNAATAWSTVVTDASWACPTLVGDAALAAAGSTVYRAEFDDPHAPDVNQVASPTFAPGAAHATDVPYLFDLLGHDYLRTPAQQRLGNAMIDYWTGFARTGVPHSGGHAAWPRVTGADGPTLQLNPTRIGTVDVAAEHRCAFWSTLSA